MFVFFVLFQSFYYIGSRLEWSFRRDGRGINQINKYSGASLNERPAERLNRLTRGSGPSLEHSLSDGPYGDFSFCDIR